MNEINNKNDKSVSKVISFKLNEEQQISASLMKKYQRNIYSDNDDDDLEDYDEEIDQEVQKNQHKDKKSKSIQT